MTLLQLGGEGGKGPDGRCGEEQHGGEPMTVRFVIEICHESHRLNVAHISKQP